MSNHKNALKTAWNDVTGDSLRTGKGRNEKYAKGWNAVFGNKEEAKLKTCIKCPRDESVHCKYCGLCQSNQTYTEWAIRLSKKQQELLDEENTVVMNGGSYPFGTEEMFRKINEHKENFSVENVSKMFGSIEAKSLTRCASHQDGDCYHKHCPQLRDNEPACSGRSCPLYDWADNDLVLASF